MKRATLALTAAAALALPAVAGADGGATGCSSPHTTATWATPGKMFQYDRATYSVNPATIGSDHGLTVGQIIAAACRS